MEMAICPNHFSTLRARSMHDVACEFARAAVGSKDAQKQLLLRISSAHATHDVARATSCISTARTESKLDKT